MEKVIRKSIDNAIDFVSSIWTDLLAAILILVIGYFLTKLIIKIARRGMDRTKIDFSLKKFFCNTIRIICYVILVISALSQVGISTTGLLAFFSAGAAAIALALKDSLSNISCGIILLFSRPFVTGDFIQFGSETGHVAQVDLMHTKIMTYDHRCVMVPNSVISSTEVVNYSTLPQRRVDVTVPVGYDADINRVKQVILDSLKTIPKVLDEPDKPFVRIMNFSESSVDFVVRVWTLTDDYWEVYHDVMETIKTALDKNDIPIPFNQLDVHMK